MQYQTDEKYGSADEIMALPAAKAVAILKDSGASVYAKAKACQRLAVVGDKAAVPALSALQTDAQLSHYARNGLETNPDPSASDALLAALPRVNGLLLAGVINSLGVRRDPKAIEALVKLRRGDDLEVVKAANAALVRIRPAI
jgi:HEAT repeat protein